MRKNPRLFTQDEYNFLHQVFLKKEPETKLSKKIQKKCGVGLDLKEINHVKNKYHRWRDDRRDTMFLPEGQLEDRGF